MVLPLGGQVRDSELVVECHVRASLLAKGDPVEGNRRETVVLSGNSDGHQPDPGVNPDTGGPVKRSTEVSRIRLKNACGCRRKAAGR